METRRMCPHCRAFITTKDRTCPYCREPVGAPRIRETPQVAVAGIPPHRFLTFLILTINLFLFGAVGLYSSQSGRGGFLDPDGVTLFLFGAKFSSAIFGEGQWWRLVTAGFLHGGILHILMNSWVMFDVGPMVDSYFGTARTLVIYFVATVTGFLASAFWTPTLSVGASAGLFGFIGAMLAFSVHVGGQQGAAIRSFFSRWIIYMLIIGLMPGLRIDNAAHLGGLAGGFATAYLAGTAQTHYTFGERFWRGAAVVVVVLIVLSFVLMYLFFVRQTAE